MSKLVVGYDGSPAARHALAYAGGRADGGTVYVVTSVAPPPEWMGSPKWQEVLDEANDRGRALLDEAREQLPREVDCVLELLEGSAADAIVKVAETREADAIVIGSRGLSRVRAVLGSVSHDVLHLADRPVVIVPERAVRNGGGQT